MRTVTHLDAAQFAAGGSIDHDEAAAIALFPPAGGREKLAAVAHGGGTVAATAELLVPDDSVRLQVKAAHPPTAGGVVKRVRGEAACHAARARDQAFVGNT